MHVVNYAEKYGTLAEAVDEDDGLAVLGVFFQVSQPVSQSVSQSVSRPISQSITKSIN